MKDISASNIAKNDVTKSYRGNTMSIFKHIECTKHENILLEGDYNICIVCGECKSVGDEKRVPMRPIHYVILDELMHMFPRFFRKNRTSFFWSEIWRYIYEKKVVRITIMGETRGGKSEEAQTIAINYTRIFNALLKKGHFKKIDITYDTGAGIEISHLEIETDHIHANQSSYLYHLRDVTRDKKLKFGQIHIIDEDRDNIGGIGSFSEEMEIENLNNIVAKFMQAEIWITPKRFQTMNTPYGLNCLIKDEENKINWSLIYKIEMSSAGLREQNFLGWVGISLHKEKSLRDKYQQKKNSWIEQELKGTINERAQRRMNAIEVMLKDEFFTQHVINKDGKIKWYHGIESMKFLVEQAMSEQKIDQFNDTEIERIVHGARAIGEQRLLKPKVTV